MKIDVWRSLLRYPQSLCALILFGATICSLPIAAHAKGSNLYGLGLVKKSETFRCPTITQSSINLLAPDDGGKTLLDRPTVYFYTNLKPLAIHGKDSFSIVFRLREGVISNKTKTIFKVISRDFDIASSGLYSLTLPPNAPALEMGKIYTWNILFKMPPFETISRAFIKRESNPSVEQQVKIAPTDLEKARILAKNRYWYDALHLYSIWILAHPDDTIALSERKAMLDEIVDKPKDKCYGKSELYDSSSINAPQPIQQILQ